jgi:hypothetical protein
MRDSISGTSALFVYRSYLLQKETRKMLLQYIYLRLEVLNALKMSTVVFIVVMPCGLAGH